MNPLAGAIGKLKLKKKKKSTGASSGFGSLGNRIARLRMKTASKISRDRYKKSGARASMKPTDRGPF